LTYSREKGIENEENKTIPDLDVYIVDSWPSKTATIYSDYDWQVNRLNDIRFHNRTEYDVKVSLFISDYVNLSKQIRALAVEATNSIQDTKKKIQMGKQIDDLLNSNGISVKRSGVKRKYRDLLTGGSTIKHVMAIKRKEDPNDISNKWADFSSETISEMIRDGYEEALVQLKDQL